MKKRYLSCIGAIFCAASLAGCALSEAEASQAAVSQGQAETETEQTAATISGRNSSGIWYMP